MQGGVSGGEEYGDRVSVHLSLTRGVPDDDDDDADALDYYGHLYMM